MNRTIWVWVQAGDWGMRVVCQCWGAMGLGGRVLWWVPWFRPRWSVRGQRWRFLWAPFHGLCPSVGHLDIGRGVPVSPLVKLEFQERDYLWALGEAGAGQPVD